MLKIKELLKGSHVAMVVAGLVVAGVASAALVSYLANDVVVKGSVSSPIKMSVNEGDSCSDSGSVSYNFSPSFGADDVIYSTVSKNQSGGDVTGYAVTVNEQTSGGMLTGQEFTEVWATDKSTGIRYNILDDIYVVHSDGTLEQLISKTWNNPKLVTAICYDAADYAVSIPQPHAKCVNGIANDVAIKGTIASGATECVMTELVLHQAAKGYYKG